MMDYEAYWEESPLEQSALVLGADECVCSYGRDAAEGHNPPAMGEEPPVGQDKAMGMNGQCQLPSNREPKHRRQSRRELELVRRVQQQFCPKTSKSEHLLMQFFRGRSMSMDFLLPIGEVFARTVMGNQFPRFAQRRRLMLLWWFEQNWVEFRRFIETDLLIRHGEEVYCINESLVPKWKAAMPKQENP